MWVFLSDAFFSIVAHQEKRSHLVVRARKPEDINLVFPKADVKHTPASDYAYRAIISRKKVAAAMAAEVEAIDYRNFKNSVRDNERHDAYSAVWSIMMRFQHGGYKRSPQPVTPLLPFGKLPFDQPQEDRTSSGRLADMTDAEWSAWVAGEDR